MAQVSTDPDSDLADLALSEGPMLSGQADKGAWTGAYEGDALAVLDGTTVVYCNAAAQSLFGGTAEDFVGKTPWEIAPMREQDGAPGQTTSREYIREAYEQGFARFDWTYQRPDGISLQLDVSLTCINLPEGRRLVVTIRDISSIVLAKSQLRGRVEFQSFLASISNLLVTAERDGLDKCINDSLSQIGERYDLDLVRLWWNRGGEANHCSHDWSRDGKQVAGMTVKTDRVSWANRGIQAGRGYHFKSLDEFPEEAASDRAYGESQGIKSIFFTPILVDAQVHGAAFYSTVREERDWPQPVLEELELLTRLLGSVWRREEDIRRIRESEAELNRSQQVAQLGTFVETAAPGDSLDKDFGDIRLSPQACAIFGLGPGEETSEILESRIHPDDYDDAIRVPEQIGDTNARRRCNYRVQRPDGTEIRVEEWMEIEFDASGNAVRWFGTVQDITEQWNARERLKRQVRFQKRLVNMSQMFLFAKDTDLDEKIRMALRYVGKAYDIDRIGILRVDTDAGTVKRVHGWAKSGYSNEIVSVDIASVPWCTDKILAGKACHFSGLHELPDEAATDRDFYESLGFRSRFNVPVFVDNRVAGSVSFVMLREERKWTEEIRNELSLFARVGVTAWHRIESMRLIEARDAELLRSQRVAHVGSYHVEMAETGAPLKDSAGIVTLSDEARAMFQIDAGGESFDHIVSRVHPEDRQLFETSIGSLGARDSIRQYDYRVIRPDGSTIHVEDRLQADRDDDGEIIRVFGTIMDVTTRVESNLRLQSAMEEIEQLKDQLQDENIYLRKEVQSANRDKRLVGENPQFASALIAADKVAPTDVTVLILGETGTGKELVAREVHQNSTRSETPLISVNCAALSSELIESELFGHEAGAFTGADKARKGRFELADGGTLFLDEIGDLPADVQPKILRALQTGEFERLGGMRTLKVDVRLITATNRNLQAMVRDETFRADLFYRINSFPIAVPALRDRKDDIALLANHFVEKHAVRLGKRVQSISPEMIRRMQSMDWPGNVRELEGFIQRALIAANDTVLDYSDAADDFDEISVPDLDEVQYEHIVRVLERCNWVVGGAKGAAAVLGVPPSTLRSRMARLGIERPR